MDSSGLVVLLSCRECALPGVPFLAGILGIPRSFEIGVVSLVSLCCWAGFSYSSYSYAVACCSYSSGSELELDASKRVAMLDL